MVYILIIFIIDNKNIEGIPKLYYYGSLYGKNYLVMDFLGKSLGDLFAHQKNKFSLKTVCMAGIQMVR